MKRFFVFLLTASLIFCSGCSLHGQEGNDSQLYAGTALSDNPVTVATTVYPIYAAAKEITKGVGNIALVNIVSDDSGDLHNYALTVENARDLEKAGLLLFNGASDSGR